VEAAILRLPRNDLAQSPKLRECEPWRRSAVTIDERREALGNRNRRGAEFRRSERVCGGVVRERCRAGQRRAGWRSRSHWGLYERYRRRVWQVLHRVLGNDPELSDAHHEAFERALRSIGGLRDVTRLESWLIGVAVFTARSVIQRRVRRRWLLFMPPEKLPESAVAATGESSEAVRATSAVLEQLAADERIAFVLRFVEGMELYY
jgi:RNA polymerase sigma factor (sigma-70 family)